MRRVSISNLGSRAREIELTSYAEVVLAPPAADAAHPAFSKLFVQTEFVADVGALLATRRRRSPGDAEVWAAHLAVVEGETLGDVQFETDRARFLGRGREIRHGDLDARRAAAVRTRSAPCSIRSSACAAACGSRRAPRRASRSGRWSRRRAARRSTWPTSITTRRPSNARSRWRGPRPRCSSIISASVRTRRTSSSASPTTCSTSNPTLRPSSAVLKRNERGPSTLWAHGISGDLPIVLVRIDEAEDLEIVRQLLRAHEYWRMKQLAVDLVILNERPASYAQDLQAALEALVRTSQSRSRPDGRGRPRERVRAARRPGVGRGAHAAPDRGAGGAAQPPRQPLRAGQASGGRTGCTRGPSPAPSPPRVSVPRLVSSGSRDGPARRPSRAPLRPEIEFFNGLGGFAADGREYVTILGEGQWTPAPWINVIANPSFGFQVSVEGGGYTWSSQQPREPAHAVVERSRRRPPGRGALRPRRRQRRALVSDGAADSRGGRRLRRPTRPGLQPLRARRARHRPRTAAVRAARRPDQDLAADDPQPVGRKPGASRSPPTWSGCSAPPAAPRRRSS